MGEPAGLEEGARPRAELRELRGHGVWGVPGRRGGVGLEKGNEGVSREAGARGGRGQVPPGRGGKGRCRREGPRCV